jgi:hypothetical protein
MIKDVGITAVISFIDSDSVLAAELVPARVPPP